LALSKRPDPSQKLQRHLKVVLEERIPFKLKRTELRPRVRGNALKNHAESGPKRGALGLAGSR